MWFRCSTFGPIVACCLVAGCGLSTPAIQEIWDVSYPAVPGDPAAGTAQPALSGTTLIEFEIKRRVYCELKDAVIKSLDYPVIHRDTPRGPVKRIEPLIPPLWLAQITLSLQVDEASSLNPGLSLNEVLPNAARTFGVGNVVTTPQSSSIGFGGTLSSTATRIDKFNPQYSIGYLAAKKSENSICYDRNDPYLSLPNGEPKSSPFLIESDLGIQDWLIGSMIVNRYIPSEIFQEKKPAPPKSSDDSCQKLTSALCKALGTCDDANKKDGQDACKKPEAAKSAAAADTAGGGGATKPDTISYEIKFVIISTGNVTPTWKLVRLSANTGALPFFSAGRTRTHDLIITVGPTSQAESVHFVNQLGAAINGPNRLVAPSLQ